MTQLSKDAPQEGVRTMNIKKVKRVEIHKIKPNHPSYKCLVNLSHLSNNLYNQANYIVRQTFINDGVYLNYYELDRLFRKDKSLQENWSQMPSQSKQQVLRLLDQNWKSFFKSIKDWSKNKSKYLGKPNLPKYRPKGGQYLLILTSQEFRLKTDGYLHCAKKYNNLKIKTTLTNRNEEIKQIRILPKNNYFKIEVIYEKEINKSEKNSSKVASIDLGLENIVTLVTNFDTIPLIIKGKKLKSINQYFNYKILSAKKELNIKQNHIKLNKEKSLKRAKTALDMKRLYHEDPDLFKQIIDANSNSNLKSNNDVQFTSKRIQRLWLKRENKILNELHQISSKIIKYCKELRIDTIVVGHNKNQKQKSSLKHFVSLPIFRLISLLAYKAEEANIKIVEINEAYTSGTSFLDNETPNRSNYDKVRRLKRGLFKSNSGQLINSDVNAAYQIMRKFNNDLNINYSHKVFNPVICKV